MSKFWTWNGRALAHPMVIARRLVAWPFYMLIKLALVGVVLFGWGMDEATRTWENV